MKDKKVQIGAHVLRVHSEGSSLVFLAAVLVVFRCVFAGAADFFSGFLTGLLVVRGLRAGVLLVVLAFGFFSAGSVFEASFFAAGLAFALFFTGFRSALRLAGFSGSGALSSFPPTSAVSPDSSFGIMRKRPADFGGG